MSFLATGINTSATIVGKVGAAHSVAFDVRGKGVKYDANGEFVLAKKGDTVIGIAIITNADTVKAGDEIDVQVKEMGLVLAGAAIATGAELALNADGKAVPAEAGDFVIGTALEPATAAGKYTRFAFGKSYKNQADTIIGTVGAGVSTATALAGKAIKYDASGELVPATAGDVCVGIASANNPATSIADDDLEVQFVGVCNVVSGASFSAGAELASDANGKLITAVAAKNVIAIALEAATAADKTVKAVITRYQKNAQ